MARKDEIEIMRLVGARNAFIRRPFVLEGLVVGLLGGAVALLLTRALYHLVDRFLFAVDWLPLEWIALGVVAGGVFGLLSSRLAVGRHLRKI